MYCISLGDLLRQAHRKLVFHLRASNVIDRALNAGSETALSYASRSIEHRDKIWNASYVLFWSVRTLFRLFRTRRCCVGARAQEVKCKHGASKFVVLHADRHSLLHHSHCHQYRRIQTTRRAHPSKELILCGNSLTLNHASTSHSTSRFEWERLMFTAAWNIMTAPAPHVLHPPRHHIAAVPAAHLMPILASAVFAQ